MQGLTLATAGALSSLTISARDRFGRELYANVGRIGIFQNQSTVGSCVITVAVASAEHAVSYTPTVSGDYVLKVCGATRNGLVGEYFDDILLEAPLFTRSDPNVDFYWARGVPGSRLLAGDLKQPDGFAVRWTGFVYSALQQAHTFKVAVAEADERVRLWLDDMMIIDQVRKDMHAKAHALLRCLTCPARRTCKSSRLVEMP